MKASHYIFKNERLDNLFKSVSEDDVDICSSIKKYEKGTIIMKKGDILTKLIFLFKGDIKIVNEFRSGLNYTKMQLKAFMLLGHIEALSGEDYIANTIMAETDCIGIEMAKSDFLRLINNNHKFSIEITKQLAKDFYITIINQGEHLLNSSLYKLVKLFIDIADISFLDKNNENVAVSVIRETKKSMSERMGVSERTVNRNILKLKELEYILIRNRKIIITKDNYEKLKKYIETL